MTFPLYYKGENKMRCSCCGTNKYDKDRMKHTEDGYVCWDCYDRYYRICGICGAPFKYKNHDHKNCNKCEDKIYNNPINYYSTKPFPRFVNFGSDSRDDLGCRYYGLEMEFSHTNADEIHISMKDLYKKSLLYNKSDSSLRSGVEVVTSPMDKKSLVKLLKDMELTGFKKVGKGYNENAGLHIHVNISTIDTLDRYKLSILLNKKCTELERNIMFYLSNRNKSIELSNENHHYCSLGSTTRYNYKDGLDRHIALNVRNSNTFEFRLFKSSNDVDTILSYIYMVDSMIDFCHNNGIKDINITNYIVYIKNKKENKILLDKIDEFEKLHGTFVKFSNIISSKYTYSLMKGIKWYEFYKLLAYIDNESCIDTRSLAKAISDYKEDIQNGKLRYKLNKIPYGKNRLSKSMINTIKSIIVNKMMKEVTKCA